MPRSQPSSRAVFAVVACCLPLLALAATAPPATAQSQQSHVSITNVTHTPTSPTVGETFEVEAVVQNHADGGSFTVNQVVVRGPDSDTYVAHDLGTLSGGSSMPVSLPVSFDDPGQHTFTVFVYGNDAAGNAVSIRTPTTVRVVEDSNPQLELEVQKAVPNATRPVNVTVGNGRTSDIRQVAVTVSSPSVAFDLTQRVRATIAAGNTTTFRFPATVAESGRHPVSVQLAYTDNGVRHRVNRTFQANFDAPSNPGAVVLTDVDAVARGDSLELSATASNVGSTDVEGVVVSTGESSTIGSADYFVGQIEGSDFSSFTLTTNASGNVSSVPIEVRYVVDGVEKTTVREVPVDHAVVDRPETDGGGPPVVPAVGVVGVLVLVGVVYRWRR